MSEGFEPYAVGPEPVQTAPAEPPASIAPVSYASAPTERELELNAWAYHVDPARDRIAPVVMIVAGLALFASHYTRHYHPSAVQLSALICIRALLVLPESILLTAFAYFAANWLDVSFGRLSAAHLKFFAIMMVADGLVAAFTNPARQSWRSFGAATIGASFGAGAILFYTFSVAYLFNQSLLDARRYHRVLAAFCLVMRSILMLNHAVFVFWIGNIPVNPLGGPVPRFHIR
jgi:hypothetical protein